jgi:hypothetical protein
MSWYILIAFGMMLTYDLLLIPQRVNMGFWLRFFMLLFWPLFAFLLLAAIFRDE